MKRTADELQDSIAKRVDGLRRALGDPFEEDPRLQSYATALSTTDAGLPKKKTRPRVAFLERADDFLAAHEVGLAVIRDTQARVGWELLTTRAMWLFQIESIHRGHVRTIAGLKSLETAFFTEWNESSGAQTDAFWDLVAQRRLRYARRDLLAEILEAGRIKTREHYEFAVDLLSTFNEEQASTVERMIAEFEASS